MVHPAAVRPGRQWQRGAIVLSASPLAVAQEVSTAKVTSYVATIVLPARATNLRMMVILSCATFAFLGLLVVLKPSLAPAAWSKLKARGLGGNTSIGHASLVLCTISMFMIIGPALMMLNKHIMQERSFSYPLSLSGLGVIASVLFSRAAVSFGYATLRQESMQVVSGLNWWKTALPIGACKALTLATGNAVYLHLGLGFIQMLKAFTPAVVLVVMRVFGAVQPKKPAVFFVFVIVAGTLVEVKGELNATTLGICLMMMSEVCEACNLVLTQKLLQNHKFSVLEALYVLAPPQAMCLFGAAAFLEWPNMWRNGSMAIPLAHPYLFMGAAALGLAVNFVGMQLVQVTSSLFSKILNTVRCVGLVCIGGIFYGEEHTWIEIFGYCIALSGFAGYNYVQMFPDQSDRLEHAINRLCCSDSTHFVQVEQDNREDGEPMVYGRGSPRGTSPSPRGARDV